MKKTKLPLFYWVLLLVIGVVVGLFAKMYDESASQVNAISRDGIITDIQKLSRLQSVAFSIDTVITANKAGTWQRLWQDEQKGLFVARGRVLSGVDLSNITPEMVQVSERDGADGKQMHIMISVPPSEIFAVYLDDLEVYDWQTGLFGAVNNDSQVLAQAWISAKNEVLNKACQGDVLTLAATNAAEQIKGLFMMTGASVEVVSQGTGACQMP
ncbi:DUF4230 domain-containing protein [Moraxella haemolytica]|uniref:DUF4230 domain-containing protein n=1 Tax=Moraxella haemolytica TaxID=2904119 RepID=UPI0025438CCE|nr:DUF4230 domain-containing protein [Moraxella sp. ZY171148]WII94773.1 DUF4230 domain-containing protein [Moraxella sp. ZY171148]